MPETDADPPQSLGSALRWLRGRLPEQVRDQAEALLLGVLRLQRSVLFSRPETPLPAEDRILLRDAADRLADGEPLAYVLGRQGFWSFELAVGPEVLIPRPDSEVLVRMALQRLPPQQPHWLADLGTGSGALALALASERPQSRVLAVERSLAALRTARDNARRLGLCNLDWLAADWLSALRQPFDLIVSNPPYLAEDDPHLGRDGLDREPRQALVAGSDGLSAIRRIVHDAVPLLRAGGWLLLEHGWQQGAAVRQMLGLSGYAEVFSERDLGGRERVSGGRRP